jgi:hypothetical protein
VGAQDLSAINLQGPILTFPRGGGRNINHATHKSNFHKTTCNGLTITPILHHSTDFAPSASSIAARNITPCRSTDVMAQYSNP